MTTPNEWTWEPDDFAALWYSEAYDRFPRPLRYRSRFAYLADFQAHRDAVLDRCSDEEMTQIRYALHTLGSSQVRIEILCGTTRTKNSDTVQCRLLGARDRDEAVVLRQIIRSDDPERIQLRRCRRDQLPVRLINWLVPADAGGLPPASYLAHELRDDADCEFHDFFDEEPSARERYRWFRDRPADGGGSAALYSGPILARPQPIRMLQWYDHSGDGRYTESRRGDRIEVAPAGPRDLAARFAAWLTGDIRGFDCAR
ncbi:ESX secretion-associated protein EspG [Nocardia sp. NPDC127579]|uniref:ESX secretion-associated protein EspG n=1 Tax=Nocardia sp. NPDC127579 TaxID=3345402 RepID=UPI003645A76C